MGISNKNISYHLHSVWGELVTSIKCFIYIVKFSNCGEFSIIFSILHMREMEIEEVTYLDSHNFLVVELEFELQICMMVSTQSSLYQRNLLVF